MDAWACREGGPEDEEDAGARLEVAEGDGEGGQEVVGV